MLDLYLAIGWLLAGHWLVIDWSLIGHWLAIGRFVVSPNPRPILSPSGIPSFPKNRLPGLIPGILDVPCPVSG